MSDPAVATHCSISGRLTVLLVAIFTMLSLVSSCTGDRTGKTHQREPKAWADGAQLFDSFECIRDTVQEGESLFQLLTQNGLTPLQSLQIISATEHIDNLAKNYPQESYMILVDRSGKPFELRYRRLDDRQVIVGGDEKSYWVRVDKPTARVSVTSAEGSLQSSLYLAFMDQGLKPELLLQFADVFSWTVDFLTECRVGDRFKVVYTEEGGTGRTTLLGASYYQTDTTFVAISLRDPDGRTEYYAPDGTNMRKAFLRSPLNYRRISSGFSRARYHPILKTYRPHLGVDYAAARGTPVVTIGDGVVETAGWKGGFGNYIKIKHAGGCATSYGHLSRYSKGIRRGVRVSQGQVIGYVGSTGLSTGPHLDFRIYLSGRPVNPLRFSAPPAPPLDDSRKAELTFHTFLIRDILCKEPSPASMALNEKLQQILLAEMPLKLMPSFLSFHAAEPYSLSSISGRIGYPAYL